MNIGMVIPTWKKQCGVADYTEKLIDHTTNEWVRFKVYSNIHEKLIESIKEDSIDLVHFQYEYSIYDFTALYRVMIELRRSKVPVITTLHSWSSELIPQNLLISSMSSMIIVHSEQIKQLCIQHGYPPEKLIVKPIGNRSFPLESKEMTKKLFDITGYPIIGFFGFPFPHKGIRNLIDALNQLKAYFPDIKGYFFSHYPNYLDRNHPYFSFNQELENQFVKNNHLIWTKEFLHETTLVNLLHSMDINVLPYKEHNQKGISASVRLMLAAQRPIITTDYLYFSDLKEEVFKIPNEQPETVAVSICKILLDSTFQERLIANGNQFLEKNSWEQIGIHYRDYYQKFLSESKRKGI